MHAAALISVMVTNGVIVPPYDSSKGEILKAESLKSLKSEFESKGKRVKILKVPDEWANIHDGSLIFLDLWTRYEESHSTRTDNMIPPRKDTLVFDILQCENEQSAKLFFLWCRFHRLPHIVQSGRYLIKATPEGLEWLQKHFAVRK